MAKSVRSLQRPDGGYANEPAMTVSATPATAAAICVLHYLKRPVPESAIRWLLDRVGPQGGFAAIPLTGDLASPICSRPLRPCSRLPSSVRWPRTAETSTWTIWTVSGALRAAFAATRATISSIANTRTTGFCLWGVLPVNPSIDQDSLEATIAALRGKLLAARGPQGYWEGRLSSSALSTATAVFALAVAERDKHSSLIGLGLRWLCENQNADGGWGDTVGSPSNLSTTMLCYSALRWRFRIGVTARCESAVHNSQSAMGPRRREAESWLRRTVGSLEPQALAKAVERQYGKDRTFSVPILTMCALAGRLGRARKRGDWFGRCPSSWRSFRIGCSSGCVCRSSATLCPR